MRKIIILLTFILVVSACDTVVNTDFPEPEKKLVVLSLFSPDRIMKVRLATVASLNQEGNEYENFLWVDGAVCSLFVDNSFVEVLQDTGNGTYISPSGYRPLPGKHYTIKVFHNDYSQVQATSYVPEPVPIVSVEKRDSAMVEAGDFSTTFLSFVKVRINNTLDSVQFMEFFLTQATPRNTSWDTLYYYAMGMKYPGPVLSSGVKLSNAYMFSSGNLAPGTNILSVYYFPMHIWVDHRELIYKNLQVHLRVLSFDYYYYKLTSSLGDNYDEFWNGTYQPMPVYSNVTGGYGIFAGYVEAVDSMSYPISLDSSKVKTF